MYWHTSGRFHSKQTCLFFKFQIFSVSIVTSPKHRRHPTTLWPYKVYLQSTKSFVFPKFVPTSLLICFPFLSHNCHFSPLFFGHNDNLKSIRVVLKVASISRLSVLFVCLHQVTHNTFFQHFVSLLERSPIKFLFSND